MFIHKRSTIEERPDFLTPHALEQCGVGCIKPADHYQCSHGRLVAVALHRVEISYWYTLLPVSESGFCAYLIVCDVKVRLAWLRLM